MVWALPTYYPLRPMARLCCKAIKQCGRGQTERATYQVSISKHFESNYQKTTNHASKTIRGRCSGIDATIITIEANSSRGCMFYLAGTRLTGSEGESPAHHLGFAGKRLQNAHQQYRYQHGTGLADIRK